MGISMSKKTAKNQVSRSTVRRLMLRRGKNTIISRQELIRHSKLNPRTVDSYMAELEEWGIVNRETVSNGPGRPETYYRPTNVPVLFLGVHIYSREIWVMAVDIDLRPYFMDKLPINLDDHNSTWHVNQFLELINRPLSRFSSYRLLGIGMSYHHYRCGLKTKKLFQELGKALTQRYPAPINYMETADVMLLSYCRASLFLNQQQMNLALINPSDNAYLGLRLGGRSKLFAQRTNSQQKKMLEGILTHDTIVNRFRELTGNKDIREIHEYREAVFRGDPAARQLSREEAECLAAAIIRLQKHYKLDVIYLTNIISETHCRVQEIIRKTPGLGNFQVLRLREFSIIHYLTGACEVALDVSCGFFVNELTGN